MRPAYGYIASSAFILINHSGTNILSGDPFLVKLMIRTHPYLKCTAGRGQMKAKIYPSYEGICEGKFTLCSYSAVVCFVNILRQRRVFCPSLVRE